MATKKNIEKRHCKKLFSKQTLPDITEHDNKEVQITLKCMASSIFFQNNLRALYLLSRYLHKNEPYGVLLLVNIHRGPPSLKGP